jgi:hypothetical protein
MLCDLTIENCASLAEEFYITKNSTLPRQIHSEDKLYHPRMYSQILYRMKN